MKDNIMTEQSETTIEPIPDSPEEVRVTPNEEVIDLIESHPQQQSRAFWYKIKTLTEEFHLTVIAITSTGAREGVAQQFPGAAVAYLGVSDKIMQVNG